jgi:uncharacterized 2Fe-2S/4Fe-4S cluster protein (DUF4445 family)
MRLGEKVVQNEHGAYGLAVDVGTTTVEARLYRLETQMCIAETAAKNAQTRFGSDVISRIAFANTRETNRAQLKTLILLQIESLAVGLIQGSGLAPCCAVFTGNTAMLHFLTGYSTSRMATSPFEIESRFGFETRWETICGDSYQPTVFPPEMPVLLPPCVSAFIGADLISAVSAIPSPIFLLADIGTNCEIAFFNGEKLISASAAAGPAFEGGGILYGMRAASGAICRVSRTNGKFAVETIGNAEPCGICGTGLVSAVACCLDAGLIDATGKIDGEEITLYGKITLTQRDIRNLQLAKGAVRAGMEIVLDEAQFAGAAIPLYLCGAFGSLMTAEDAKRIGLIPAQSIAPVIPEGNAALDGAATMLFAGEIWHRALHLAKIAQTINLAEHPQFQTRFIGELNF